MFKGILFVLIACFIWGLIFVIPPLMSGFSTFEIALSRYFFLGILSLILLACNYTKFKQQVTPELWKKAFVLGLSANIVYYVMLVVGLIYATPPVATLIFGISPVMIALYANYTNKECSFKNLILPCGAIAAGLILVNLPALAFDFGDRTPQEYLIGLCGAVGALGLWSWFAVTNARIIKSTPHLTPDIWATLMGLATLFWVLLIMAGACCFADATFLSKYTQWSPKLGTFLLGGTILGFACSWLAHYFWNAASPRLPVSLAGQLTVFETIFGLLFIFLAEWKLPLPLELAGIIIMLTGVTISLARFKADPIPQEAL